MKKRSSERPKMYVVRKYIKAVDVKQALRLEPKTPVHDCWIDDSWKDKSLAEVIGFDDGREYDDEEETSYT